MMFAILGATGKVRRTTIKQLRSQGAPVRAVVHKSSNADDLSALGCEITAATLGNILGREVVARKLPQSDWIPILTQAGAGPSYARLVFDLYVTHNAGRIDVEPGATDTRFSTTELRDVFVSLLGR